jgi:hypothetical protein
MKPRAVRIPDDLYRKVIEKAKDVSLSVVIRLLLQMWVEGKIKLVVGENAEENHTSS